MKKWIAFILCLITATSLAACTRRPGSDGGTGSTSATSTTQSTTETAEAAATTDTTDEAADYLTPILPQISPPEPAPEELVAEDDELVIVFMGDSQFENGTENGTDIASIVGQYTHAHTLNLGMGGTCAALVKNESASLENWGSRSFYGVTLMLQGVASRQSMEGRPQLAVMESIDPSTVDYYVISYGLNDFYNGVTHHIQGQENVEWNYYGALDMGMNNLRSISPQAQFIVCTPAYTQFYGKDGAYLGDSHVYYLNGVNLNEFAEQARHVGYAHNALVLDAAFDTMFNLNSTNAEAYLEDGVHLTERGRQIYALALSYLIARDQGWTEQKIEKIDIDHPEWVDGFLADIP